jgi:ATPase subunit of ABC transporter with duplicated ATPase domains
VFVPYEQGELCGRVYAQCRVIHSHATPRGTQFLIEGAPAIVEQLARACRKRTPMNAAPLLEAHDVTVETPGGRVLVRDLNLHLGRECVAVVGRNGVGKSTLIDVLAARQAAAGGHVIRHGRHLLVPQHSGRDADADHQFTESLGERHVGLASLEAALAAWPVGLLVVSHDPEYLEAIGVSRRIEL